MFNNRHKRFTAACKEVFATPQGLTILAYLKSAYMDGSALDKTPEMTYYRLGQKELIQSLVQATDRDEELEDRINKLNQLDLEGDV
jgi:hypothetical protein